MTPRKEGTIDPDTIAAVATFLSIGATQPKDAPYASEGAARTCVNKRLTELVAQEHRDISGDPALIARTTELKAELKKNGKSDCEVIDYSAWLVVDENSKLRGLSGQPYTPDKGFLKHCESLKNDKKTPPTKQR